MDCPLCEGTGLIIDNALWQIKGLLIRNYREKNRISLREFCRTHNIDASNMSKMEHGIINSNPHVIKFIIDQTN